MPKPSLPNLPRPASHALFGLSAAGRLGSLVTATVGAIALLRVINRPRL